MGQLHLEFIHSVYSEMALLIESQEGNGKKSYKQTNSQTQTLGFHFHTNNNGPYSSCLKSC